jgi:transcriptional regulator with XRE-family HTH domain
MSENGQDWSNGPNSIPKLHPRRKYSVKLAAALRGGRSILGISQAAFAREIGISKSKLARAETAAGAISSETLEYALGLFTRVGIDINLSLDGDLQITLPDDSLRLVAVSMTNDAVRTVPITEHIVDVDEAGHLKTTPDKE